jgi:hypothetical protein
VIDYRELMTILSVPRPNGSPAEGITRRALTAWLERKGIPYQLQPFKKFPFFFECLGVWLILSRGLLALAIWLRWGCMSVPIALLGSIGGTLNYVFNWPLATWISERRGGEYPCSVRTPEPGSRGYPLRSLRYENRVA